MPKKKKQSKNWNQPGLRTPKNLFIQKHKLLVVIIVFILGGAIGVTLQQYSKAQCGSVRGCLPPPGPPPVQPNDPKLLACMDYTKMDVIILMDVSASMLGYSPSNMPPDDYKDWDLSKYTADDEAVAILTGTTWPPDTKFAVGPMHEGANWVLGGVAEAAYIASTIKPTKATQGASYPSPKAVWGDPRPNVPNHIHVISDLGFNPYYAQGPYDVDNPPVCPPGPSPGPSPSPTPGPGGPGNGGTGPGTGGGGSGSGNTGSGTGRRGSGSGGGGTSATRQAEKPNPIPTPSPQGTKKQDPPKQEPSPFFDGKLYGIGSDPDAQSPTDLVKNPGKALKNVWFYAFVGTVLLGGGAGAGYWFWWRKRR